MEKIGFGWEEVHDIAEQIEHIQSSAFFCKNGSNFRFSRSRSKRLPIPDANGNLKLKQFTKLSDCNTGDMVRFMAVKPSSEDLLKFLNSRQLLLGAIITIVSVEPFDRSMVVNYVSNEKGALSNMVCKKLLIEPFNINCTIEFSIPTEEDGR